MSELARIFAGGSGRRMTMKEATEGGYTGAIVQYLRTLSTNCNAAYKAKLIADFAQRDPMKYGTLAGRSNLERAIAALVEARMLEAITGVNPNTRERITVLRIQHLGG